MASLTANTIAAAFAIVVSSSCASAAEGGVEQRQACMRDAFSFCGDKIPDVERITACMIKNLGKLSAPCRAQFMTAGKGP